MGKYTIISDGKKINMFDRELEVNLSLKGLILNCYFSIIVNKVGIFITADTPSVISELGNYYEKESLSGFYGPVIFIQISKYLNLFEDNKDHIYRIESQNNIVKSAYKDDYLFHSDGISIKINKGLHFGEIRYKDFRSYKEFMPYLIKIMEGLIIENHLRMGEFPIHASLVEGRDEECILIMGKSQSGKTTTAELLCEDHGFRILSDDITFVDRSGYAYPYGHYCKFMYNKKESNYIEHIKGNKETIYRGIIKLTNSYRPYKISTIILPQIMCIDKTECISMSNEDIWISLTDLLSEYPNKWFLYSDYNDVLGYLVRHTLSKNKFYRISLKYQSDNTEFSKILEDICII